MYHLLIQQQEKLKLIHKAKIAAKAYFREWKCEQPNEYRKFWKERGIQIDKDGDPIGCEYAPFKIGYEIRIGQENTIALSVVLDIVAKDKKGDNRQICIYYCFFDENGNVLDEFIDNFAI